MTKKEKQEVHSSKIQQIKEDVRLDEFLDRVRERVRAEVTDGHRLLKEFRGFCGRRMTVASEKLRVMSTKYLRSEKTAEIRRQISSRTEKIRETERKVEDKAASLVCAADETALKVEEKCKCLWALENEKEEVLLTWASKRKKRLLAGASGCAAVVFAVTLLIGHFTAYEYMYDGKVLGVVEDQNDVYETVDLIGDRLARAYGVNIKIDPEKDISFHRIWKSDVKLDSQDDVLSAFTYLKDMNASAYALYIDGKQVAILDSRKTADAILRDIQDQCLTQDRSAYSKIGFAEAVKGKTIETRIGNIQSANDVKEYLLTGSTEKEIYTVQPGDTFSVIAKSNGFKQSELLAVNPDVTPGKLKVGQELVMNKICPMVTVQTAQIATYEEAIPYEIAYEDTDALYKGETSVKLQGTNGTKKVKAEIVCTNGKETSRTILAEKTISEPVSQIVLRGTNERPYYVGSGDYIYPTRGRLSSGFGSRWGRMHNGIDLATSTGSSIVAADGGVVTYAGYKGSFGNLIILNHGNGMETYYAHCSQILVSKGDKVAQGDLIGKVGSTGRSTGPHCHFEIRINGDPQNPLNYL